VKTVEEGKNRKREQLKKLSFNCHDRLKYCNTVILPAVKFSHNPFLVLAYLLQKGLLELEFRMEKKSRHT